MPSRRDVLTYGSAASVATLIAPAAGAAAPTVSQLLPDFDAAVGDLRTDQKLFADLYDVERGIANLDAAYYGVMPKPVHAAYLRWTEWVNRHNSLFLRGALGETRDAMLDRARAAVASVLRCRADEVALCSNGTEALYSLITNYRPLKTGDAVVIADIDYDEMQYAMEYLRDSRGAEFVRVAIPEPSTAANVLAAYDRALRDAPRAKLLLLTHISNKHGLVTPVREIIAMAKARGVDVILDSAQAIGHLEFTVDELGADFVGFSVHKWLAAPLGAGGVYIRRERQGDIAPYLGNRLLPPEDVRARLLTGTINFAAHLAIPTAVDLHQQIGPQRKLKHLLALRDYWVDRVRDVPGLEIMVPDEPGRYGAITSFRPKGLDRWEDAQRFQETLLKKHRVLTVARRGLASGPAIRVTPGLYSTTAELDQLVTAIRAEAA